MQHYSNVTEKGNRKWAINYKLTLTCRRAKIFQNLCRFSRTQCRMMQKLWGQFRKVNKIHMTWHTGAANQCSHKLFSQSEQTHIVCVWRAGREQKLSRNHGRRCCSNQQSGKIPKYVEMNNNLQGCQVSENDKSGTHVTRQSNQIIHTLYIIKTVCLLGRIHLLS